MSEQNLCANCQTTLNGSYCHICGEKVVGEKDFTMRKIIGDGFGALTNLDSKIFKTFFSLLSKPGLLCEAYLNGIRKPYLKPFSVLIISNVLFFLFLKEVDLLLIPAQWFFISNFEFFNLNVTAIAQCMADKKGISMEEVRLLYTANLVPNSKLFVVLIVPLFALVTYPIGYKKLQEYGKHNILAIYLLSFFLVLCVVWLNLFSFLFPGSPKSWFIYSICAIYISYVVISFRRVFSDPIWKAILKGLYFFVFLFVIIFTYRFLVSYYTLISL